MKTIKRALIVAALVSLPVTQGSCDSVKRFLAQIPVLFDCECLCRCLEAYRGGGDGSISGGGVSFRCVNRNGASSCATRCDFESLPGLVGGGNLLLCSDS